MSGTSSTMLSACSACRHQAPRVLSRRAFSLSTTRRAPEKESETEPSAEPSSAPASPLAKFDPAVKTRVPVPSLDSIIEGAYDTRTAWKKPQAAPGSSESPHRLHIYTHRHNTHLTLVQAPRLATDTMSSTINMTSATAAEKKKKIDVLMSMSAGQLGFRKAARGSFDAAFQLGAYFLTQMKDRGMMRDLKQLEIVMRGFGPGRDAMQKIILGSEGQQLRSRIVAVMDATRLKIGGCRSPKPRRLG